MDLNLFLLSPDEIRLIQEINNARVTIMGQPFSFVDVKNCTSSTLPVDLVIIKDEDNGKVRAQLEAGIEQIRRIIDKELKKRRGEAESEGRLCEPRPELPNYDNEGIFEPIFPTWDDDEECDDVPDMPYDDWFGHNFGDRAEFLMEQMIDSDQGSNARLSNDDLLQLDAAIAVLMWKLIRLAPSGTGVTSSIKFSGSLLGLYYVEYDANSKVLSRTVYLMIDSITDFAASKGVPREYVIAEVYVHEMMHAYYDDVDTKNLITAYLRGISELEEPFAEFGMLCFLNEFDPVLLPFAYYNVRSKLSAGPHLQCYGLGALMYDKWYLGNHVKFTASPLETYQKIMPSPRLSMRLVRKYRNAANSSLFRPDACLIMIHMIVGTYDGLIADTHQHFLFNDVSYPYSKNLVYDVLDYYAAHTGHGLSVMEADFDNYNPVYGKWHVFEIAAHINNSNSSYYQMDRSIILNDGTTIYPACYWRSDPGGNMAAFLDKVKVLKARGILDEAVITLR